MAPPTPNPRPKRPASALPPSSSSSSTTQLPANLLSTLAASSSSTKSSKKPRFSARNPSALASTADDALSDEDETDPTLALDSLSGQTAGGLKRGAINLDGFESDSENEGFDGRVEAKVRERREREREEREDEDMFASQDGESGGDEDGEDEEGVSKKKKRVQFMDGERIEGQDMRSRAGGHVSGNFTVAGKGKGKGKGKARATSPSSSSSSSSGGEGEGSPALIPKTDGPISADDLHELGQGSSKTHAPTLDAFNMKSELDEGAFDASGNYVRRAADPAAMHDSWLADVGGRKDVKRAAAAAERREKEGREKLRQEERRDLGALLGGMIGAMERGETVLEALGRLGAGGKRKKKKRVYKRRARDALKSQAEEGEMDVDGDDDDGKKKAESPPQHDKEEEEEDAAEQKRRSAVEAITEGADALLKRGKTDVYDAERELLIRWYRAETGDEWVDQSSTTTTTTTSTSASKEQEEEEGKGKWEYRWTDGRDDGGQVYGPFDVATMRAWRDAGFFGEGVEFRSVGRGEQGWSRLGEF